MQHSCRVRVSLGDLFLAITSSEEMSKWMGEQAIMNARVNGHFVFWNGEVVGVNRYISLRTLVQDWKFATWKQYSKVTLDLIEDRRAGTTTLSVVQEEFPEEATAALTLFWEQTFFAPLKAFLEA